MHLYVFTGTVIQLTLETMQGHLLRAETTEYIGGLLALMEASDAVIKVSPRCNPQNADTPHFIITYIGL